MPRASSPPAARTLILLVAIAALLTITVPAQAGTYTVESCQDTSGNLLTTDAWTLHTDGDPGDLSDQSCPRGGYHLALKAGEAHPAPDYERLVFSAPADTQIVSYKLWRSATVASGTKYLFSIQEETGTTWNWGAPICRGDETACPTGVGDPTNPLAAGNELDRIPPMPVTGLGVYVSCGEDNGGTTACPTTTGVPVEAWMHRAAVTLSDDLKPAIPATPTGGPVDATAPVTGIAPVSILASDRGGGLTQAKVEIDGNVVAAQPLGGSAACQPPYTERVPCPLNAGATIPVDTTALADGTHAIRVLVDDVAGNETAWGPVTFRSVNAKPDASCDTQPAVSGPQLFTGGLTTAKKGASGKPALTVHYSSKLPSRLTGQLLQAGGGAPLGNAPVCVVGRADGTQGTPQPLAHVVTGADGRFSYTIPRGSSRELWAIYRTPAGAVTQHVRLRVVPKVTLHPSRRTLRNGALLTLTGTVSGGPIPSRGVLVRAEAWRGTHWQPFGEVHARTSDGHFRIRYRFTGTTGSQRYTLRAHVEAQAAYPYLAGVSARLHVRVHG